MIEAALGLMGGGAAAEGLTIGGATVPVVVEVAGGAVVVVGGAIVAEGAFAALSGAVSEAQMLRAAFSANKRPQSCYGDAPDPGRLRKVTRKEVRTYGLEPIEQEGGVPAPADLYTDPFTGRIYYQVNGGPFQWIEHVPQLKTR